MNPRDVMALDSNSLDLRSHLFTADDQIARSVLSGNGFYGCFHRRPYDGAVPSFSILVEAGIQLRGLDGTYFIYRSITQSFCCQYPR